MPESEVARLIDGNIHGVLRPTKAVLARCTKCAAVP